MTLKIQLTAGEKERIVKQHGNEVAERLEGKIESKNETLQWKRNIESCSQRFHNMIERHGEYFPEIYFTANSSDYRAILCWVEERETFVVLSVVRKEEYYQTSTQKKILNTIENHPRQVVDQARKQITQDSKHGSQPTGIA